jgi:hypothetical protein
MVSSRSLSLVAIIVLASSGLLFLLSPLAMPADYNWVSNSISESGAQQLTGAWVTRLGFISFGLGVILTALVNWSIWKSFGAWLLSGFGFLMLTVAAFSTKQWDASIPFNEIENTLHSLSASVMGFFYGIGVLLVILAEKNASLALKVLGWIAVVTSIAMPILVGVVPEFGGVFQRLMFAIAITWFIVQVVQVRKDSRS